MKLGFAMPHMLQLKATMQPWELQVTGADQTRLAKWAEKLGYEMIAVPEHHIIPANHVELSGPFYFNAYTAMAHFSGATERTPASRSCPRSTRSSRQRRCRRWIGFRAGESPSPLP